jgi:hypothetical protein
VHDLADNAARRVVSPQRSRNGRPVQLITGSLGDGAWGVGVSEPYPAGFEEHFLRERYRVVAGSRSYRGRFGWNAP